MCRRRKQNKRYIYAPGVLLVALMLICGCALPTRTPYVPRSRSAQPTYCNDLTGHITGNKPYIMGGKCCCTPSEKLLKLLQRDGYCVGMTVDDLRTLYHERGIILKGGENVTPMEKHVLLGGRSLIPPPPGTWEWEVAVGAVPRLPSPAETGEAGK